MGESVWWVMTSMLMTDFRTFQSHVILMFLEDIEYVNQGRSVSTQLCSGGNCNLTASTAYFFLPFWGFFYSTNSIR